MCTVGLQDLLFLPCFSFLQQYWGLNPRTSHLLSKCSTTELCPSPLFIFYQRYIPFDKKHPQFSVLALLSMLLFCKPGLLGSHGYLSSCVISSLCLIILLSVMTFQVIHIVTDGWLSLFLKFNNIPLCIYNDILIIPLFIDIQDISIL